MELNYTMNIILGIGLFVLGLRKFPSSIEKIISRMKSSKNLQLTGVFYPYLMGLILAIIFQASSIAVIAMMIFMVYARVQFHSAFAFMLGATLGTSLKFWVFTPDLIYVATTLIIVSQFFYVFANNYKYRSILSASCWLGLIFLGWGLLKEGTSTIINNSNAEFLKFIVSEASSLELLGLGFVLTSFIQSSSSVISIASELIHNSTTGYYDIGLMVLGANIGTAVTAIIVGLWLPIQSRRLAIAQFGVKLFGVLFCFLSYNTFLGMVDTLLIKPFHLELDKQVFAIHSAFNFFNSIIFLSLVPVIEKIMNGVLKDKDKKEVEDIFISKRLFQLLSNVPEEGLQEAKKQFRHLSFSIKAFEDQIIKSLTEKGIRASLSAYSLKLISHMRTIEELILIIRTKHPQHRTEAHEILLDFFRLRKILTRADALREFIQDMEREELDESAQLLDGFIQEWEVYRSKVWQSLFLGSKGEEFKPLSQIMSTSFLKSHDNIDARAKSLNNTYRIGLFLISLTESWELLWRHQKFDLNRARCSQREQNNTLFIGRLEKYEEIHP